MSPAFRLKLSCAAIAIGAASCAALDAPVALPEGHWEITAASFTDINHMPGIQRATLLIRDGRISAFSGCNTGVGAVSASGGKLVVAAMASTRRACLNPTGDFENRYFKLLQAQPSIRIEGDTLSLVAGEDSLRFRRGVEKPRP
jgi:heat shock protein HslJ